MQRIYDKCRRREPLSREEAYRLYDQAPLQELALVADEVRRAVVPDPEVVTWQIDRNVNITNVCISGCRFCNFHCKPHQTDRAFVTTLAEYREKIDRTLELGGDQLLTGLLATDCYPTNEKGVLLYADPAADEAVAGRVDVENAALELRHHCLGLHTLDLFRRDTAGTWDSLLRTETLDITDFLLDVSANAGRYCRLCFDAEADKLYLVSIPAGSSIAVGASIKVREYDRKTLAAKDYTVPNNTGGTLRGLVSESRATPLNGTVYGGSLYMTNPATYQIYRFPLSDPTDVQAVTMHSDYMQPLCDAHDGRLYCYYRTRGVVLNTEKNELFSCEAAGYDTASSGFSTTVPVLGEPAAPLRRYLSDNRIRTERVLRANYLATINDLPKAVEKTADKTMKVIYTLRKGEDA